MPTMKSEIIITKTDLHLQAPTSGLQVLMGKII